MGGTQVMNDRLEMIQFPGVYILLRKGEPLAPPAGSVVDHFGLAFKDLHAWLAKWKANGIEIEQNQNPLQGYVHAPDGIRVEFFGDPSLDAPVKMDHRFGRADRLGNFLAAMRARMDCDRRSGSNQAVQHQ